MRRKKEVVVHLGSLEGRGNTITEARADLQKKVDWACRWNRTVTEIRFGHVIIVSPSAQGYASRIVEPENLLQHGKVLDSTCFYGQVDVETVLDRTRQDVAQRAWRHDVVDDDKHISTAHLSNEGADELRSWIKFQRLYNYKQHKDAGATDGQAREKACRGESVSVNPRVPHEVAS